MIRLRIGSASALRRSRTLEREADIYNPYIRMNGDMRTRDCQDRSRNGAKSRRARNPEGREMPKGAKSRRARNPRGRKIPNGAKSRTAPRARNPKRRGILEGDVARLGLAPPPSPALTGRAAAEVRFRPTVWDFAPFGISRPLGFRALWDFAPFGIFAPFSPSRRLCSSELRIVLSLHVRQWQPKPRV